MQYIMPVEILGGWLAVKVDNKIFKIFYNYKAKLWTLFKHLRKGKTSLTHKFNFSAKNSNFSYL